MSHRRTPAKRFLVAACLAAATLATQGCGSGVKTPGPSITSLSPPATFGGTAIHLRVNGGGFKQTAAVLFNGTVHAASFESDTAISLSLTAQEIGTANHNTIAVQNSPAEVSNAATWKIVQRATYDAMHAYGDSITAGSAAPTGQRYVDLTSTALGLPLVDYGLGGDRACDLMPRQILTGSDATATVSKRLYTLMAGTNDADNGAPFGTGTNFQNCHLAAVAWLGVPASQKHTAADPQWSATAACSTGADSAHLGTMYCPGTGTLQFSAVDTGGHTLYLWYLLDDAASADSRINVTVGTYTGSVSTTGSGTIHTLNGTTASIGILRIPAPAGPQTVKLQASGGAGVLGVGWPPSESQQVAPVVVGEVPNQLVTSPSAPVAIQLGFDQDVIGNVLTLQGDTLDVRLATNRSTMLGLAEEMGDQVHPNPLGHKHLADAFIAAATLTPAP